MSTTETETAQAPTPQAHAPETEPPRTGELIVSPTDTPSGAALVREFNADDFVRQIEALDRVRKAVLSKLKEGVDYGKVSGIPKPFLWQPGASKILFGFNCFPRYAITVESQEPYRVMASCEIVSRASGQVVFVGPRRSASSEEREWSRRPVAEVKDLVDAKAQKRAYVHAARNMSGVEDVFTQDEDLVERPASDRNGAVRATSSETKEDGTSATPAQLAKLTRLAKGNQQTLDELLAMQQLPKPTKAQASDLIGKMIAGGVKEIW